MYMYMHVHQLGFLPLPVVSGNWAQSIQEPRRRRAQARLAGCGNAVMSHDLGARPHAVRMVHAVRNDTAVALGKVGASRLFRRLFPSMPMIPSQLWPCAARFKVLTYNLPDGFHLDLLVAMARWRGSSNCDWMRSPCTELHRSNFYSRNRQFAAEVPLLAKLLLLPQTTNPDEADLFVVPWFVAASQFSMNEAWKSNGVQTFQKSGAKLRELMPHLTYFYGERRQRHVFLASKDFEDVFDHLKALVAESGAFLLHYGPRLRMAPNGTHGSTVPTRHIVVPPNDAGFGLPLDPLAYPTTRHVFYMMSPISHMRQVFGTQVRMLAKRHPSLNITAHGFHGTLNSPLSRATLPVTPERALQEMRRSLLCPILQGDLPMQHRFFDVAVAGCLPLFINTTLNTSACEIWSWLEDEHDPRKGFCEQDVYPFPSLIDYHKVAVVLSTEEFHRTSASVFALAAPSVTRQLLDQRRHLEAIRPLFVYNWTRSTFDAASGVFHEIACTLSAACCRE